MIHLNSIKSFLDGKNNEPGNFKAGILRERVLLCPQKLGHQSSLLGCWINPIGNKRNFLLFLEVNRKKVLFFFGGKKRFSYITLN